MNRGEHQLSGERAVDGDLGSLLVADVADHDLIRVVAQNGAQPAREGQPLFLVDRNLGDALDLILHRIFDGDDLVFVVLDLAQRRIKGSGLAGACGSGDQHHAVRLADIAPELGEVGFGKADAGDATFKSGTGGAAELGELLYCGPQALLVHVAHGRLRVGEETYEQEDRERKDPAKLHEGTCGNSIGIMAAIACARSHHEMPGCGPLRDLG